MIGRVDSYVGAQHGTHGIAGGAGVGGGRAPFVAMTGCVRAAMAEARREEASGT